MILSPEDVSDWGNKIPYSVRRRMTSLVVPTGGAQLNWGKVRSDSHSAKTSSHFWDWWTEILQVASQVLEE